MATTDFAYFNRGEALPAIFGPSATTDFQSYNRTEAFPVLISSALTGGASSVTKIIRTVHGLAVDTFSPAAHMVLIGGRHKLGGR